jgi:hypothetical protein
MPSGACCVGSRCDIVTRILCEQRGGTFQGTSVVCDPNRCEPIHLTIDLWSDSCSVRSVGTWPEDLWSLDDTLAPIEHDGETPVPCHWRLYNHATMTLHFDLAGIPRPDSVVFSWNGRGTSYSGPDESYAEVLVNGLAATSCFYLPPPWAVYTLDGSTIRDFLAPHDNTIEIRLCGYYPACWIHQIRLEAWKY